MPVGKKADFDKTEIYLIALINFRENALAHFIYSVLFFFFCNKMAVFEKQV